MYGEPYLEMANGNTSVGCLNFNFFWRVRAVRHFIRLYHCDSFFKLVNNFKLKNIIQYTYCTYMVNINVHESHI